MAADGTKGKKRKGAPASSPKAKKAKNSSDDAPAPAREAAPIKTKNAKATKDAGSMAPVPAVSEPRVVKVAEKSKKQEGKAKVTETKGASVVKASQEKVKKVKGSKNGKHADVTVLEAKAAPAHVTVTKGGAQVETEKLVADIVAETDEAEVGDDGEAGDQTAALLAGFGSDDDSEDPSEDLDFDEDIAVPKLNAKQRKAVAKAEQAAKPNEPGVIYVGRIPRGFFEKQMRQYFSQFGRVNRLRLSRNKKTGASKHFAFVEFASTEVADIVARTMDNYLLFGHILKCRLVPTDQVHPDLFKGAGQRFKVDPRNKKAGLAMERGAGRAQWEKRVAIENKRRKGRNQELKEEFGYEYTAPALKAVEDAPKKNEAKLDLVVTEETKVEAVARPKKTKKAKA